MTRINCIHPRELTDKHLLAEYRELPRVFKLARNPAPDETFPAEYTLGTGHVKFFYNKLAYCYLRQHSLVQEMKRRYFIPRFDPNSLREYHTPETQHLWRLWTPTPEAKSINRQRIKERLSK